VASEAIQASATTLPTASGQLVRWAKVDVPAGLAADATSGPSNAIFGWSRGYVAFHEAMGSGPVAPWTSADGRTWQVGTSLDVTGLPFGASIEEGAEGPAGLVAVGRHPGCADDGSGCTPEPATAIWTSTEGRAWSRLDMQDAFGASAVGDVSAGPEGYMALSPSTDAATASPVIWLSSNGTKWRKVALPDSAFTDAYLARGMVVPDGYVIAGRIGSVAGHGSGDYPATTPAVWWSSDGVAWTRVELPGVEVAPEAEAAVTKVADGRLVARVVAWDCPGPGCTVDGADNTWTSTDGRVWAIAQGRLPLQLMFTDGHRALTVGELDGAVTVETSADGFNLSRLAASGDSPPDILDAAYGPSGLLIEATDESLYQAMIESTGT
jgi:hypothetical protein